MFQTFSAHDVHDALLTTYATEPCEGLKKVGFCCILFISLSYSYRKVSSNSTITQVRASLNA